MSDSEKLRVSSSTNTSSLLRWEGVANKGNRSRNRDRVEALKSRVGSEMTLFTEVYVLFEEQGRDEIRFEIKQPPFIILPNGMKNSIVRNGLFRDAAST